MRPINPSIGIAPCQRVGPGNSDSSAGMKTSSHRHPSVLAMGETTLRERNQRAPSIAGNTGSRKAPMPKPWNMRSEIIAPTTPIQLRAARVEVSTEALLSDGSSGEYDASARKRRSAETHNRKPISSLSRRLLVGAKIRDRYFMGVMDTAEDTSAAPTTPELYDYYRKFAARQSEKSIE